MPPPVISPKGIITVFFGSLAKGWVVKALSTAISVSAMFSFHSIVKSFPDQAIKIMKKIMDIYYTPWPEWAGFVSGYIERMTGSKISLEDITKTGFGHMSKSSMMALGEKFLNPMLGLIMPTPPLTIEKGTDGANAFLAANLQFQMSAWLLHLIGDTVSFGSLKSLKDLPNAISWSFGIGWLSWLVMGAPFRKGIADPLERLYNRIYVYALPTISQAIDGVRHGIISMDDYVDICLDLGYSPQRAAMLYKTAQKDLTDADIRKFLQLGWMSEDEAVEEFVRRGYEPNRAGILTRLEADRRKFDIIDDIVKEAEDLFLDRLVDERTLRSYYEEASYTKEEVTLKMGLLELKRSKRRLLTPAQIYQAYNKDLISFAEARDYLVGLLRYTTVDADMYMKIRGNGGE